MLYIKRIVLVEKGDDPSTFLSRAKSQWGVRDPLAVRVQDSAGTVLGTTIPTSYGRYPLSNTATGQTWCGVSWIEAAVTPPSMPVPVSEVAPMEEVSHPTCGTPPASDNDETDYDKHVEGEGVLHAHTMTQENAVLQDEIDLALEREMARVSVVSESVHDTFTQWTDAVHPQPGGVLFDAPSSVANQFQGWSSNFTEGKSMDYETAVSEPPVEAHRHADPTIAEDASVHGDGCVGMALVEPTFTYPVEEVRSEAQDSSSCSTGEPRSTTHETASMVKVTDVEEHIAMFTEVSNHHPSVEKPKMEETPTPRATPGLIAEGLPAAMELEEVPATYSFEEVIPITDRSTMPPAAGEGESFNTYPVEDLCYTSPALDTREKVYTASPDTIEEVTGPANTCMMEEVKSEAEQHATTPESDEAESPSEEHSTPLVDFEEAQAPETGTESVHAQREAEPAQIAEEAEAPRADAAPAEMANAAEEACFHAISSTLVADSAPIDVRTLVRNDGLILLEIITLQGSIVSGLVVNISASLKSEEGRATGVQHYALQLVPVNIKSIDEKTIHGVLEFSIVSDVTAAAETVNGGAGMTNSHLVRELVVPPESTMMPTNAAHVANTICLSTTNFYFPNCFLLKSGVYLVSNVLCVESKCTTGPVIVELNLTEDSSLITVQPTKRTTLLRYGDRCYFVCTWSVFKSFSSSVRAQVLVEVNRTPAAQAVEIHIHGEPPRPDEESNAHFMYWVNTTQVSNVPCGKAELALLQSMLPVFCIMQVMAAENAEHERSEVSTHAVASVGSMDLLPE